MVIPKDVDPYSIVAGTPAEKIGELFKSNTKEKLRDIAFELERRKDATEYRVLYD